MTNLDRKVRLHDPIALSICLHLDSPLHCNKLLQVKTILKHFLLYWTKDIVLPLLFRPFCHFCLHHKCWNVARCQADQDCAWSAKNCSSERRKRLNLSQLFLLRNFFAQALSNMSLLMPVTYFAQNFLLSFLHWKLAFSSLQQLAKVPLGKHWYKYSQILGISIVKQTMVKGRFQFK